MTYLNSEILNVKSMRKIASDASVGCHWYLQDDAVWLESPPSYPVSLRTGRHPLVVASVGPSRDFSASVVLYKGRNPRFGGGASFAGTRIRVLGFFPVVVQDLSHSMSPTPTCISGEFATHRHLVDGPHREIVPWLNRKRRDRAHQSG